MRPRPIWPKGGTTQIRPMSTPGLRARAFRMPPGSPRLTNPWLRPLGPTGVPCKKTLPHQARLPRSQSPSLSWDLAVFSPTPPMWMTSGPTLLVEETASLKFLSSAGIPHSFGRKTEKRKTRPTPGSVDSFGISNSIPRSSAFHPWWPSKWMWSNNSHCRPPVKP